MLSGMKANGRISAGVKQMGARLICSEVGVGEDGGEAGFVVIESMGGNVELAVCVGPDTSTRVPDRSPRVTNQGNTAASEISTHTACASCYYQHEKNG